MRALATRKNDLHILMAKLLSRDVFSTIFPFVIKTTGLFFIPAISSIGQSVEFIKSPNIYGSCLRGTTRTPVEALHEYVTCVVRNVLKIHRRNQTDYHFYIRQLSAPRETVRQICKIFGAMVYFTEIEPSTWTVERVSEKSIRLTRALSSF